MTVETHTLSLTSIGSDQRVLTAGTGQPVLLLHGNPDSAEEWIPLMQRLGDSLYSIAPDMPGYGASAKLPDDFSYTIESQKRFIDEVLSELSISEPLTLVVHDIGAMAGIPWAIDNMDRIHSLIITNTVAFEGFSWFSMVRLWGSNSFLGRLKAKALMAAIGLRKGSRFQQLFAKQNPQLPEADVRRMTETFALNPNAKHACLRQFREVMRPAFFDGFDDMTRMLAENKPVKVLWGTGDPYIRDDYAHAFGGAEVQLLENVGHWVPLVATDRLAEVVKTVMSTPQ